MSEAEDNSTELPEGAPETEEAQSAQETAGEENAAASDSAEPVLNEDEVAALINGVENGDVEVHSATGPRYATVKSFDVPKRSRISTRSLPKLDALNERLADRLRIRSEELLTIELGIEAVPTSMARFGELIEHETSSLAAIEFSAEPLAGRGALTIDSDLVGRLVDLFFGGSQNETSDAASDILTPGILRVIEVFSKLVLDALQATWEPLFAFEAKSVTTESNLSLLNIADESDSVVRSRFDFDIDGQVGALEILLPEKMIEGLMPVLRGNHREPNPAQDQLWADCLQGAMPGVVVNLSTTTGHAQMSLGDLICLEPGDIITISDPTNATVLANSVSLMSGRFGVHAGQNAVATQAWLSENTD